MDLGPWELILILILLIVLVIFGGAKLPQMGKNLGQAIREFRKASRSDDGAAQPEEALQPVACKEQSKG